jgi:hypothetical protein
MASQVIMRLNNQPAPPLPSTTSQGENFQTTNASIANNASAKSRVCPMAFTHTG